METFGRCGGSSLYKIVILQVGTHSKTSALQGYDKKLNVLGPSDDVPALLNALATTPLTYTAWQTNIQPLFNLWDWFTYNWVHSRLFSFRVLTKRN